MEAELQIIKTIGELFTDSTLGQLYVNYILQEAVKNLGI